MAESPKPIIVANWKMNPQSFDEAEKLFTTIRKIATTLRNIDTVICPPSVFLSELFQSYSGNKVKLGAQNVFWENGGSFTGEVSTRQLRDVGAEFCIVGHSERRALGETNTLMGKKRKGLF